MGVVFAPHSPFKREIVLRPEQKKGFQFRDETETGDGERGQVLSDSWAKMLAKVFKKEWCCPLSGQVREVTLLLALIAAAPKWLRAPDAVAEFNPPFATATIPVTDERILRGLDFLPVDMGRHRMIAVMCLSNDWHWSGGFAQYLNWASTGPIPYPPPAHGDNWNRFKAYSQDT